MDSKQKIPFLLALVSLFIFLTLIQDSYAKYVSNADASTNLTIARWNIKINNQDIVNNNNFSDNIVPVFPGNDYIAQDIIAPTSEGYFDLIIDYSNVDVAFNKTISINPGQDNTIEDLKITGYSVDGEELIHFTDTTIITNSVELNQTNKTQTYRIYIKWIDDENEIMTNEDDTNATINGMATINVNVSFIQSIS